MKVTIDASALTEVESLLRRMPVMVVAAGGPLDRAVGKAGTVVARRARQLAPNSRKTGSRKKQSKKAQAKWPVKLRTTIRSVVRRYPTTALGVIGPKSPEGNAAHFMQEKGRKHVLWNKATALQKFRIERNWITKAFDETKAEQESAMIASLRKDLDEVMRR